MGKFRIVLKEQEDNRGELLYQMPVGDMQINFFLGGAEGSFLISAYVGDEQNKIGDIQVIYKRSLSVNGDKAFGVKWIGVKEAYRGKGIAGRLYRLAIAQVKKYGGNKFYSDDRRSPNSEAIWSRWKANGLPITLQPFKSGKIKNATRYCLDLTA